MFKCLKWLFDFNFVQDKYITVIHTKSNSLEIVERLRFLGIHCIEEQYSNIPVIHSNTMFDNATKTRSHKVIFYDLFKLPHGIFRIKILNNYILIERV